MGRITDWEDFLDPDDVAERDLDGAEERADARADAEYEPDEPADKSARKSPGERP